MQQNPAHRNHWHEEFRRVAAAAVLGILLGMVFGHAGWFMAGALAIYLLWTLTELLKLHRWLSAGNPGHPPDSFGLWGEIFDGIYRLQKREQAARDELQSIIDRARESVVALRDAVVIMKADGTLEWWNPAAEELLGLHWPQDKDQPVANLVRDPRFTGYLAAGDYRRVLDMPSPRSDSVHLEIQITVFGNSDRLMTVRDVTRLHQLEQMRRDFIANVSHELKTPLTVIRGYLETLADDNSGNAAPGHRRALAQMAQQARRMDLLVNDLLMLSRLESTPPDSAKNVVAIRAMLDNIRHDVMAASGKAQRINLTVADERNLLGNDSELQSAFSNILANAARYTRPDGEINMRWWTNDQGAHLAIADNGIGIEPHHIPRLTERFYRTDAGRSIEVGGTGLGLAIVKHVLKRHDAVLDIHSEPGKGSTFTCHFPPHRIAR